MTSFGVYDGRWRECEIEIRIPNGGLRNHVVQTQVLSSSTDIRCKEILYWNHKWSSCFWLKQKELFILIYRLIEISLILILISNIRTGAKRTNFPRHFATKILRAWLFSSTCNSLRFVLISSLLILNTWLRTLLRNTSHLLYKFTDKSVKLELKKYVQPRAKYSKLLNGF
jgi:hypothetical protein